MINSEELLFIVDEENNPLGSEVRRKAHANGTWHRTSGIWIKNSQKQVLCQKRSLRKDVKPGMWEAFFGGHLSPGEEYLQNAAREVNEELGLSISLDKLVPFKVYKSDKPTHKEFQHVFGLIIDMPLSEFHFEKEEVEEVVWKDIHEVRNILTVEKNPEWVQKTWDTEVLNWLEHLS